MEVTKDIPVPPPSNGGRPYKDPFLNMQVGDSFTVPLTGQPHNDGGDVASNRVRNAGKRYTTKTGARFTVRVLKDEGVVRCWRIE